MPPRRVFRRPNGEKAIRVLIETYPSREDLKAAIVRRVIDGRQDMPKTQAQTVAMFEDDALAGHWGETYDASDEDFRRIDDALDTLFPALREGL